MKPTREQKRALAFWALRLRKNNPLQSWRQTSSLLDVPAATLIRWQNLLTSEEKASV